MNSADHWRLGHLIGNRFSPLVQSHSIFDSPAQFTLIAVQAVDAGFSLNV